MGSFRDVSGALPWRRRACAAMDARRFTRQTAGRVGLPKPSGIILVAVGARDGAAHALLQPRGVDDHLSFDDVDDGGQRNHGVACVLDVDDHVLRPDLADGAEFLLRALRERLVPDFDRRQLFLCHALIMPWPGRHCIGLGAGLPLAAGAAEKALYTLATHLYGSPRRAPPRAAEPRRR